MKIKRWVREPEDYECFDDTETLLAAMSRSLDKSGLNEVVLFEGEDDKMYTGSIEFVIEEADPEFVKQEEENLTNGQ